MEPRPPRLAELDALRGIAAFLVLLHHALGLSGFDPRTDAGLAERLAHTLLNVTPLRAIDSGRSPVLFFFVLSGFVLTRALLRGGGAPPGLGAFAAQRTIRLGLPVLASVLLSAGLCHLLAGPGGVPDQPPGAMWSRAPGVLDVLRAAALLRVQSPDQPPLNPVLWSLVHEWRLTLLMPLVLLFRGRAWWLLALAAAAMALGIMGGALEDRVMLGPKLHSTVAATLYFAPGIATGAALALAGPLPALTRGQRLAAGTGALALAGMQSDVAIYAASALLILLAVQQADGWLRPVLRRRPLVWLGRVSFSLYLVHLPVLMALVAAAPGLGLPRGAALLAGLPLALLAAAAMRALVERPARDLAVRTERALSRRQGATAA